MDYEKWYKGTYQGYNDPSEWNGTNPSCKLCEKEIEPFDEYCENHQRCIMCGNNDDCNCEEYWGGRSNCCEAPMDIDRKICLDKDCGEHCESAWQDAVVSLGQN